MRFAVLFVTFLVAVSALDIKATFSVATDGVPAALFQFEQVDSKGGVYVLNWNRCGLPSRWSSRFC
jgi:hypothetical protein